MKVMFVGDINLGEYYTGFGHGPKSYAKKRSVFSSVNKVFAEADFVVGNLEAPITEKKNHSSDPEDQVLKVSPDSTWQLKEAGFKVLQVANNHIVQHGDDVFEETIEHLQSLDIQAVGIDNQLPVVMEHKGVSIAFFAASDVPDNTDKNQKKYQRLDDEFLQRVENNVKNYDHVIVMLHWGLEECTTPMDYQRKLADRLKKAGVSAIIGSHTHLFYEIEYEKNFICAYSLGNFVFDLCWDKRMLKSGILQIEFSKESLKYNVWPVFLKNDGCNPVFSGEAISANETLTLYDHGLKMDRQQMRKTISFLLNIYKGKTILKLKFFIKKIFNAVFAQTAND